MFQSILSILCSIRKLCNTKDITLSQIQENVRELVRLCHECNGPKVIIIAIAMKSTLPHFVKLAEWAIAAGVDGIRVHWLTTRSPDLISNESISAEEAHPVLRSMGRMLRSKGLFYDYPYSRGVEKLFSALTGLHFVKRRMEYLLFYMRKFLASRRKNGCRAAGNLLEVADDKNVYLCPGKVMNAGNIVTEEEPVIIRNIRSMSRTLKKSRFEECRSCAFIE